MASLTMASSSSSCGLASSASSFAGVARVSAPAACLPSVRRSSGLDVVARLEAGKKSSSGDGAEEMKRRAVVVGTLASALAFFTNASNANAEENKAKKNTCPKLCVQNRTASCCFGN